MNESSSPMFSVIMPVYNHAAYVCEAIRSVVAQTFADWELRIVDDGSTDSSDRIVEEWAGRDRRIHTLHQSNAGPAAARNAGIARATGRWLAFLDSDDVYMPDALANFRDFIADHPQATFVHGYSRRLSSDGSVSERARLHQDRPSGTAELFQRMFLSHPNLCLRRDLLAQTGPYDDRLPILEDYDLFLRMSLHTRFWPMGKVTALRRRHDTNISRQTGFTRRLEGAVLRRFLDRHGGRELLDERAVAGRLGKIYYAAGRQYFRGGYFLDATEALRTALNYKPTPKAALLMVLANILAVFGRRDGRALPEL